jgi:hypothetical protein
MNPYEAPQTVTERPVMTSKAREACALLASIPLLFVCGAMAYAIWGHLLEDPEFVSSRQSNIFALVLSGLATFAQFIIAYVCFLDCRENPNPKGNP